MIEARRFVEIARVLGFQMYTGVPCSYLKLLVNCVIRSPEFRYIDASHEGDTVAIAAGAELGGHGAVVMIQNSGLGNAINPLTSRNQIAALIHAIAETLAEVEIYRPLDDDGGAALARNY